jgi:hypothetical protein
MSQLLEAADNRACFRGTYRGDAARDLLVLIVAWTGALYADVLQIRIRTTSDALVSLYMLRMENMENICPTVRSPNSIVPTQSVNHDRVKNASGIWCALMHAFRIYTAMAINSNQS